VKFILFHSNERSYRLLTRLWIIIGISFFTIFTQTASAVSEATFPRHPAVSPDGSSVAFSYGGDIWTVPVGGGRATRLTVHQAYEHSPSWSPDSKWIAFCANREGYEDVYVIPSEGGQSRRLTYLDADNTECSWMFNSQAILFTSRRDDRYPDYRMIYSVPVSGGTPVKVMEAYGRQAVESPDGKSMLYVRDGVQWWRKHYRGSKSAQVWQYNITSAEHITVTDTLNKQTGNDYRIPSSSWSLWGSDGSIYVTSDRDGVKNLWKRDLNGNWTQITFYENDGIRFPSISHNGHVIAYEYGLDIYIIRNDSSPQKLNITAPIDDLNTTPKRLTYNDKADKVVFGPNGRQLFFEVRGEVFAGRIVGEDEKAARGRANSLSENNPSRDGDFIVSPGGDSLIFTSDCEGNRDLYLVYSDDPSTTELARSRKLHLERLTYNSAEDHKPQWSPDERYIAFMRGKGDLYIYDLEKREERQLLAGWSLLQYVWSPDGKWIAYAREDDEYNSDVFIIPVEDGTQVNISRHPDEDEYPVWSADGKKLGFRSKRRENNWDVYFVFLNLDDHYKHPVDRAEERFAKSDPKSKDESDEKKDKKKKKKKDKDEQKLVEVKIDTTDIYRRIRTITSLPGEEGIFTISPDGETFAFTSDHEGERDIYSIKWTGKDQERLSKGGKDPKWLQFSPDGKDVRFLDKQGRVHSIPAGGGKTKDYPFEAIIWTQPLAERQQKFAETWRGLNDRFYDPDFHGSDWRAMYEKYLPMIPFASTEQDFGDIVKMMIGELNSSHSGYNSPHGNNDHLVGRLGLDFDETYSGPGFLIEHVLPRGPCDRVEVHLQPGDKLMAINGTMIDSTTNIHQLLDYQVYQQIELTILSGRDEQQLFVRPMGRWPIGQLRYDEWVRNHRAMVDSLSGGRLGYLHIKGMGKGSLSRFEAQLYSVSSGKDGLVIDVRYNSGGWITDYLLAMLQVRRHAVTYPRDGGPGYPQGRLPLYSWVKPVIVLCNQHSFSNAEIFSHAIKTLERGKLVGVPTPGGVISTDWRRLIDGSGYRVPLRGWYTGTELERNQSRCMEGNGAVPDIIIPMQPGQMAFGDDLQLRMAVEELMK